MALPQLYDMVRMTTATTGTGTVTLGAAVAGFLSFASAGVANGATVRYAIADTGAAPAAREWGTGIYTSVGTTLTRVLGGSSTGSLLNLSGSAHVVITPMSGDFIPSVQYLPAATGGVARPVVGKLNEVTSVVDLGADITGVALSTAAFQAAATAGGTFWIPDGRYSIGAITAGANPSYWHGGKVLDAAGALPLTLPGVQDAWYLNSKFFYQPVAGAADQSTVRIQRTVNYIGGTPAYVNAALLILSDINTSNATYECGLQIVLNTYAAASENYGFGSQAHKRGTGPAWSCALEVHDHMGANPATGAIGIEMAMYGNGTDANTQRIGLAIIGGRTGSIGTDVNIGAAINIADQVTDPAHSTFDNGILFGRTGTTTKIVTGINFTPATISNVAILMATDQRISFIADATRTIRYNATVVGTRYEAPAGKTFDFLDSGNLAITGAIMIVGTQVITSRRTGWGSPTGIVDRTAFDPSTVTLVVLAEHVAALINDLATHGLIGA